MNHAISKLSFIRKIAFCVEIGLAFFHQAKAQYTIAGQNFYYATPGQAVTDVRQITFPASGGTPGHPYLIYGCEVSATSGVALANNFQLLFDGTTIATFSGPGDHFSVDGPPYLDYVNFSYYLLPSAPLCSQQYITIKFYQWSSDFQIPSHEVMQYTYTIYNKDYSKNNLIALASGMYYVTDNDKIDHLYWSVNTGGWVHESITPYNGWGNVLVAGWLAADYNNDQIFFKGEDNVLYNIYKSGNVWYLGPVSAIANVKSDIELRGDGVYYQNISNGIQHMYWTGNPGWASETITPVNGWQGIIAAGSIALSKTGSNIFFRTSTNKIVNLIGSTNNWSLYQLYSTPASADCGGEIICDDALGIYYKGTDSKVHKMSYNSGWIYDAMTPAYGSATVASSLTKFPGEERIFCKTTDGRTCNYYKNALNQWVVDGLYNGMTGVAGDVVAADTKVYFINTNKLIYNYYWTGSFWYPDHLVSTPANAKSCSYIYRLANPENNSSDSITDALDVYPNPTNGFLNVDFGTMGHHTVTVIDMTGREIFRAETDEPQLPIDLSMEEKGLFLLRITGEGQETIRKVLLQ